MYAFSLYKTFLTKRKLSEIKERFNSKMVFTSLKSREIGFGLYTYN